MSLAPSPAIFRHRWLWIILIVMVLAGLAFIFTRPDDKPAPSSVKVKQRDLEHVVLASGTLEAFRQVNVGAQVSGQLKSLKVELGDRVQNGQLVAEIDDRSQQTALLTAKADLATRKAAQVSRQATLRRAELSHARQRRMAANESTARADLEQAEAELAVARADVESVKAEISKAQAEVARAEVDLGYTRIVSPIDGVVVAVVTKEGQTVSAVQMAPTIIKVAQTEKMTVKAEISEADVVLVEPGQKLYFSILGDPDKRYDGVLRAIEPAPRSAQKEDASSAYGGTSAGTSKEAVYYDGLFEVANPDGRLRIAMTTQVFIVLNQAPQALSIPAAALGPRGEDGRYAVEVLSANGKTETRQIRVGLNNNVDVEVLDGLEDGQRVVTGRGLLHEKQPAP